MNKTGFSRRTFFKGAMAVASLWMLNAWDKVVSTQLVSLQKKRWKFPFYSNKKITFFDEFIVVNDKSNTQVFSAHCTHLGCLIHDVKDGKLVCPCHGSTYDLAGRVFQGVPAPLNLVVPEHSYPKENVLLVGVAPDESKGDA